MTEIQPAADPLAPRGISPWVFWPAAVVVVVIAGFAMIFPAVAEETFAELQAAIVSTFSWYYVLIAAFFVAFALVLGFSRFGDIKLGKDDDDPEFSLGAWFSLLFAAGMGIGLVFYGVSEPLSHFVNPRPGVTGTDAQLAQNALIQTYLHWGVQAWAIYVVVGVALAYAIHRRRRPISIRWALEPLLGKRVRGVWGNVIDALALVGTIFGVATSLGLGVLQIGAGLDAAGFGAPDTFTQILIIGVITVFVLASVLSGVARGMKWLSTFNLLLAGLLLVFVLFAGQTVYLLREWVQSIGSYLQNYIGLSFTVSAFQGEAGEQWQAAWTSFYWGWWISWAPFVGIFIARVSKGRTVREFVLGVLIVPTLVGILWFAVLGGSALYQELQQPGSMLTPDGGVNLQGALFQLFTHLPAGQVLTIGAIILIAIFFVTSADSGALVMGMLATGGDAEPRRWIRVFFTVATSVLAVALLLAGGLTALQTAAITIALPFSVVMLLICWATVIAFRRERRVYDRAERAHLVEYVGEHYGLDVESGNEQGVRMPSWLRPRRSSPR
ncbi:BCCT family transporter [Microbacterium dextranolyticum]|uniref:Choline transporter n=1 Tax=Microbacterium dextranolyticum TaxID=36806 RepID=A0A9W6M4T6_9MICO|nr:BCCT family transporter [Microbacterium dextranolyticum]MBM7461811.1 choline/glycine/proline betaine transport protein [Microbacterium dextranolyticum]GLJ94052.1 choline transporter [Microbacterium dextranolyticum]